MHSKPLGARVSRVHDYARSLHEDEKPLWHQLSSLASFVYIKGLRLVQQLV